jgi:hypothetical protein
MSPGCAARAPWGCAWGSGRVCTSRVADP